MEEHNLMVISRNRKIDKSVISAGVKEHNSEEDPHCNIATAEIKIECSELSQPPCSGSVKNAAEDDEDMSYLLNISKFGESSVCVNTR